MYLSVFLLIALLGVNDAIAEVGCIPRTAVERFWGLGLEFAAVWVYMSPCWKPVATALIGR